MKYTTVRLGAVGATLVTTGLIAVSGVASAAPLRSSSSPCAHGNGSSSTSRSWEASRDQWHWSGERWSGANYRMMSSWNQWNPMTFASNGGSFSEWWNGVMGQMSGYGSANWASNGSNSNWMPAGNNWQSSWSNWNPAMWESHGSSYANWYNQMMSYMNSNSGNFQSEFSDSNS